jgi:hypothetical protein
MVCQMFIVRDRAGGLVNPQIIDGNPLPATSSIVDLVIVLAP